MLSASEVRQLERLSLASSAAAPASGARLARARGHGLEFTDYRAYQPGDDPRSIDWTVDARLRQLVVRVYQAEGHTRLHLLVDVSGSMGIGVPSKLTLARRLAAALAFVAVERRDPVGVALFDGRVRTMLPPSGGRRQFLRVFQSMQSAEATGRSHANAALQTYGSAVRGPGLAVVLSDFLGGGTPLEGLSYLLYRGLTPAVVQILADEDEVPVFDDEEVELVDSEDLHAAPLVVDASTLDAYRAQLAGVSSTLQRFCAERAIPWVQLRASSSLDAAIDQLRRAGVLAVHG